MSAMTQSLYEKKINVCVCVCVCMSVYVYVRSKADHTICLQFISSLQIS